MHNSLKEKVLESTDIVELVGERVSLTRKGREYVGLCPFHDDHKPSMSVSPAKQIFKCWSCGAAGTAIKFVELSQRVEFREALHILARRAGIDYRGGGSRDDAASGPRDQMREALTWAEGHFQRNLQETANGRRALEYAHRRGMTDATIERFGIGYAADAWDDLTSRAQQAGVTPDVLRLTGLVSVNDEKRRVYDRFRNRLIFPIRDVMGRCVAFGGRTLGDDPAKYLNSPETPLFNKSRILYGLDTARRAIGHADETIVVEGYTDATLLAQAGIENVVATLGTALTDAHMKLLAPLCRRVVMCFDSDEAGVRAADRAVETAMRHRIEVKVAVMPDGQDPADCVIGTGPEAVKSLLLSALGALEFKWNGIKDAFREQGAHGKREAAEAFLRFVARVGLAGGIDPLEQGLLIGRVADLISLPSGEVYALLGRAKSSVAHEQATAHTADPDDSPYELALRGLPKGLAAAIEELFGLILSVPERYPLARDALAVGAAGCGLWRRLFEIVDGLHSQAGAFTRADVLARCEDEALCELVERARQRTRLADGSTEMTDALCARVEEEMEAMRLGALRGELRGVERDQDKRERAFRSFLDVARRRQGVLGAEHRIRPAPGTWADRTSEPEAGVST